MLPRLPFLVELVLYTNISASDAFLTHSRGQTTSALLVDGRDPGVLILKTARAPLTVNGFQGHSILRWWPLLFKWAHHPIHHPDDDSGSFPSHC